ncbi:hypothetical protein POM88_001116 [Heracleum sosnowskyi]|uniref:Cyclin C-terminal domain-containing protein n=1 Tax=Heracleum sosnowskyi TaxID=360622 RepID=A0AAD8JD31_9APIA|nr:hypothetical protein POM88_001116 [Heracleum sosnowskyi]
MVFDRTHTIGIPGPIHQVFSSIRSRASAVYAARCTLNKCRFQTETLKHHTGYTEVQLRDCAKPLVSYHTVFQKIENILKHNLHASQKLHRQIVSSVPDLDPSLMGATFGWESENSLPKDLLYGIESLAGAILVDSDYRKDIAFLHSTTFGSLGFSRVTQDFTCERIASVVPKGELCVEKACSCDNSLAAVKVEVKASGIIYKESCTTPNKAEAKKLASKAVLKSLKRAWLQGLVLICLGVFMLLPDVYQGHATGQISPAVLKQSSNSRKQAHASCNVLRKIWIVCTENLPWEMGVYDESDKFLVDDSCTMLCLILYPQRYVFPFFFSSKDKHDTSFGWLSALNDPDTMSLTLFKKKPNNI